MTNHDTRKLPRSAAEAIRKRVVSAVVNEGLQQKEAARLFGVTTTSVCMWMKAYRANGEKALNTKRLGRPKGQKLSRELAAGVRKSIVGKCPDQLRLPGFLWTRESVSLLIERRSGLCLSQSTVGRYLKEWGLTVQKPVRRAFERNPDHVRYWLISKYPAIREQAKAEKATIWWGDEAGLRSDHQTGTTWGEKGKTPVVKTTGKRFGCNMISAIANTGGLRFMVFEERFTSPIFIDFMERLIKTSPEKKVYFIVDRHAVHKSRATQQWLESHKEQILLFYLPAYSPDLNPDELLNQDLKNNARRHQRATSKPEMLRNVRSFLRKRQKTPQLVQRFFNAKQVQYAA